MAGFLDSQQQIIDMVLTSHGKMLLSHGELRFVYWAAYDDDVIYSSLSSSTEDPLQREAVSGYKMFSSRGDDNTNVHRPLITVPPGWDTIPSATLGTDSTQVSISQKQIIQKFANNDVNMGVLRVSESPMNVFLDYSEKSYPRDHRFDGFYVKVLSSGTHGYIQQHHTLDDDSEIVVGSDLKVTIVSPGE